MGLVMGDTFMEPQLLAELSEEKLSIEKVKREEWQSWLRCGFLDGSAPPPCSLIALVHLITRDTKLRHP